MTHAEVALIIKGYGRRFDMGMDVEVVDHEEPARDDRPEVDRADVVAAMLKGAIGGN